MGGSVEPMPSIAWELPFREVLDVVQFEVAGVPRPNKSVEWKKGAKRPTVRPEVSAQRNKIRTAFKAAFPRHKPWPKPHPVRVSARLLFKCSAPNWIGSAMTSTPDLDNVQKLMGDALNGVAYEDDSQIELLSLSKGYWRQPSTLIRIELLAVPEKPANGRVKVDEGSYLYYNMGDLMGSAVKRDGSQMYVVKAGSELSKVKELRNLHLANEWITKQYKKWIHP